MVTACSACIFQYENSSKCFIWKLSKSYFQKKIWHPGFTWAGVKVLNKLKYPKGYPFSILQRQLLQVFIVLDSDVLPV